MPVFEVICSECGRTKYPTMKERPDTYVCALCGMVTPGEREARRAASAKAVETKRSREAAS